MGKISPFKIVASVVDSVAKVISATVEGVTKVVTGVMDPIGDVVNFVMKPVSEVMEAVMSPVGDVMDATMGPVMGVIGDVGEWAGDAIAKYGPMVIKAYIAAQFGPVGAFLVNTAFDVAETGELDLERALIRGAMQVASGMIKLPDDIPMGEQTSFLDKISDGSSFSEIIDAAKTSVMEVVDDPMAWMAKEAEKQAYQFASEKFSEATGLPITVEDLKTLKEQGPEALFDKKVEEGKASIEDKTKFLQKAASGQLEPTALIENTLSSMGQPEMAEKVKFAQSMSDKIAQNPEFARDGQSMEELMKDPNVMMNLDDEQLKHAPMDMMVHVQKEDPERFNNMLKNDPVMAGSNTLWLSKQDPKVLAEMDLDEYTLDGIEAYNPDVVDKLKRIKEVSTMSEFKKSKLAAYRDEWMNAKMKEAKDAGSDFSDPVQFDYAKSEFERLWNEEGRPAAVQAIKNTDESLKKQGITEEQSSVVERIKTEDPGLWDWIKSGASSVWEGAKDLASNPNAVALAGVLGVGVGLIAKPEFTKKLLSIDQESAKIKNLEEDAFREKITGTGPQADVRTKQMAALEAVGARARGEVPSIAKTEMEQAQDRALKQQLGAVKGMRGVGAGAKLRGLERASGAARGELAEKGSLAAAKERMAAEQQYVTGLGGVRTEDVGVAKTDKASLEKMRELQLDERQKQRTARMSAAEKRREAQRILMDKAAQTLGTGLGPGKAKETPEQELKRIKAEKNLADYKKKNPVAHRGFVKQPKKSPGFIESLEGTGRNIKKGLKKFGINLQEGGPIYGPGSETSDSIPARLSDGEFVVKASAVRGLGQQMGGQNPGQDRRKGVKFLDSLQEQMGRVGQRRGEMKKFGGGGPVKGKEPEKKSKNEILRERQRLEAQLRAAGISYKFKGKKKKDLSIDKLIDMGWSEGGEAYVRPKKAFAEAIGHGGEVQFKDKALKDAKKGGAKRKFITHYAKGGAVSFKDVIKARRKKEQNNDKDIKDLDWWVESITD